MLVIEADVGFRRQVVGALDELGLPARVARNGVTGRHHLTQRRPPTVLYVAEWLPDVPSGDLLADLGGDPRFAEVPIVLRAERRDSLFASALSRMGQTVVTRESGALVIAELLCDEALLRTPFDPHWPQRLLDRARQLRERATDARNTSLALRHQTARLTNPWRNK